LYFGCRRFIIYSIFFGIIKINAYYPFFVHSSLLEIVWTLLPVYALLLISGPSFGLLYTVTELIEPAITVKSIGHQWYWSYELSNIIKDFSNSTEYKKYTEINSYIVHQDDFSDLIGRIRLLESTTTLFLPINTPIRVLVTSDDVLHSWAVPSFAIKTDACPGRLSEISMIVTRMGAYTGQCSEICGINHGFMPIICRMTSLEWYQKYIRNLYKIIKIKNLISEMKDTYIRNKFLKNLLFIKRTNESNFFENSVFIRRRTNESNFFKNSTFIKLRQIFRK